MINLLEKALQKRQGLLQELRPTQTNVFRLFGHEGIDGLVIDVYNSVAILQFFEGRCVLEDDQVLEIAHWCLGKEGIRSVYSKRFQIDRSKIAAAGDLYAPQPLVGEAVPEVISVLESGLKYRVRPYAGFQPGLFFDQRDNRQAIRGFGKKVLNLFSYTCAFSVACASQGAQVTSVDLSKKYLEWGKENFGENGISLEGQRFFCEDVFRFCAKEVRGGNRYDLVIVDPPSFSRDDRGKVFTLAKDLQRLVDAVLPTVASDGRLFLSCNLGSIETSDLENLFEKEKEKMPTLPLDFELGEHSLSYVLVKP